jgi:hypothetical protein
MSSRLPALILIAAPFSSRLSRYIRQRTEKDDAADAAQDDQGTPL